MNKSDLILIVEDSLTQALQLEDFLKSHGYSTGLAENGQVATEWMLINRPSLVISDILMPVMNGYDLCRQIKTRADTQDIPVILLTALTATDEVIEGLIAGADGFITKPYDHDYLLTHIEKILTGITGTKTEIRSFGVEISFGGKKRFIQTERQQIIKLLLSIYDGAIQQNQMLIEAQQKLNFFNENLEALVDERTLELEKELAERKRAELLLQEKTDLVIAQSENYRHLNSILNQTNDKLTIAIAKAEESDRLKTAFLANMSHEIRTPLNSIIGFSDLLCEEELGKNEVVMYSSVINASGNRLLELISNLIDISKIESGTETLNISNIVPATSIREIALQFRLMADAKSIDIAIRIPPELESYELMSDSLKLHQILVNLMGNALKFTLKGTIEIGLEQQSDGALFFVRDSGIGIGTEHINRIFERFYQADMKHTSQYQGAGLGLSLCKAMVEMLGGRIWVESGLENGSTFYFTIANGYEKETSAE